MGAVRVPAFTVYAMTREASPMMSPAAKEVAMSCVSAVTSTGRRVSASTAAPRLSGVKLSTTTSASKTASNATRRVPPGTPSLLPMRRLYHGRAGVATAEAAGAPLLSS